MNLENLVAGLPKTAFTRDEAWACGVSSARLRRMVELGYVTPLVRGAYALTSVPHTLELRAHAVALVSPQGTVATDRTAAWLHGVDVQIPGEFGLPTLQMFRAVTTSGTGLRLRGSSCESGARGLLDRDIVDLGPCMATTPLRTALDCGRNLPALHAIGAMDGLMRTGAFTSEDLRLEALRFKGFRGVVQLRELIPFVDPMSQSPAESRVRLAWVRCQDLPPPVLQHPVELPSGRWAFLDLAVPDLLYAAEYDGADFHSLEGDVMRDRQRRAELVELGWLVRVLKAREVYGPQAMPERIIRSDLVAARRRMAHFDVLRPFHVGGVL